MRMLWTNAAQDVMVQKASPACPLPMFYCKTRPSLLPISTLAVEEKAETFGAAGANCANLSSGLTLSLATLVVCLSRPARSLAQAIDWPNCLPFPPPIMARNQPSLIKLPKMVYAGKDKKGHDRKTGLSVN